MSWAYLNNLTPFGIAHRGGDTGPPENTLPAFANAAALGYKYLETDVHLSSDGVLVAFHDTDLSRLVGRPAAIGDLSWANIQTIRLEGGHSIPRLEQLLDAFPAANFNIDPKSDESVKPLTDLISKYQMVDQVCIGSFSDDRIRQAQAALGPSLCTSPGPRGVLQVLAAAVFRPGWDSPYGCLQIPPKWKNIPLANRWLIGRIHRLGMQAHFWTINEADEMNRLLDLGADAIISDEVALLANVLTHRRQPSE